MCLECSARWVFSSDGICLPVNDLCSDYDQFGLCTACYPGYVLLDATCFMQDSAFPPD